MVREGADVKVLGLVAVDVAPLTGEDRLPSADFEPGAEFGSWLPPPRRSIALVLVLGVLLAPEPPLRLGGWVSSLAPQGD